MITVRFFGMMRLKLKVSSAETEAKTVRELLERINECYDAVELSELKNCIIFVNGKNITGLKLFKTKLDDGDEVQVFSPAAGG